MSSDTPLSKTKIKIGKLAMPSNTSKFLEKFYDFIHLKAMKCLQIADVLIAFNRTWIFITLNLDLIDRLHSFCHTSGSATDIWLFCFQSQIFCIIVNNLIALCSIPSFYLRLFLFLILESCFDRASKDICDANIQHCNRLHWTGVVCRKSCGFCESN